MIISKEIFDTILLVLLILVAISIKKNNLLLQAKIILSPHKMILAIKLYIKHIKK